jgi:ABC-type bacteriocin/lantibiotic exporter with double-glycine peptidase domain
LWTDRGIDTMASGIYCLDETFSEHALEVVQLGGCVLSQFVVIVCFMALSPFKELLIAPFLCQVLQALAVCVGCSMAQSPINGYNRGRQLIREFIYTTAGGLFQVHTIGCVKQFRFSMDALLSTLAVDEIALSRIKCATGLCVSVICALFSFTIALVLVLSRESLFQGGSVVLGVHLVAAGVLLFFYMQIFVNALLNSMEIAGLKVAPMCYWIGSLHSTANTDEGDLRADIPMGTLKINQITVVHEGVATLRNFTLTLNMREYVAVIGSAGTGKTSLAMSILRLLHPVAGDIEIGGIDIETMRLAALRKYVGLVGTRPILFKGSMLANLDPAGAFQPGEVLPLLIAVGLVDKGVRNMPEAMKVVIEDVDRISSTVKQLICLCRALLRKPQLLILDEFAANIDGRRIRQIDRFLRTQDHFSVLQLSRTFQHVQVCSVVVFLNCFLCTEA